jgi:hypothetical protein
VEAPAREKQPKEKKKARAERARKTPEQLNLLNTAFKESDTCKGAPLEQLVQATGLSKESINAWFASNRFAARKRKHAET